jgi:DnaJ-class molecular chaperone
MSADYYDVLGVPRAADAATLRRAYRGLAMKWHPDKNPRDQAAANARFQVISGAYNTLHDSAKRAAYDRQLDPEPPLRPPSPESRGTSWTWGSGLSDFFYRADASDDEGLSGGESGKVHFANLDFRTTSNVIRLAFSVFGRVKDVFLTYSRGLRGSLGKGYVTFTSDEARAQCLRAGQVKIQGRTVVVSAERPIAGQRTQEAIRGRFAGRPPPSFAHCGPP